MATHAMRNGNAQALTLRDAMDRFLEQSFAPFSRGMASDTASRVPANLWEDGNSFYLRLLVPALDLSTVDITVEGGILTVTGKTTQAMPEEAKAIWQEWQPTAFRRQLKLPRGFDADRCNATYKDGVLTISIPKPEQVKPKSIKVQVQE